MCKQCRGLMLIAVDNFINSNDSQEKNETCYDMCKWSIFQAPSPAFFFLYSMWQKPCVPWELGYQATSCCWLHLTINNIGHSCALKVPTFCSLLILVILFYIHSSMNISYCQWMSYWMISHKTHKCWEQARVYKLGLLISDCFDRVQSNHPVEDFWKTYFH